MDAEMEALNDNQTWKLVPTIRQNWRNLDFRSGNSTGVGKNHSKRMHLIGCLKLIPDSLGHVLEVKI